MLQRRLITTVVAGAALAAWNVAAAQPRDNIQTTQPGGPNPVQSQQQQQQRAVGTDTMSTQGRQYPGDNAAAKQVKERRDSGDRTTTTASSRDAQNRDPNAALLFVVVPAQSPAASDERLNDGCWVRFYDATNYRGANLTLAGPTEMPKIEVPGHLWHNWDSAIVGPKARVVTYDNENYADRTAIMNPGQRIPDLGDRKLGWFEEIKSAKVSCTN